MDQTVRRHAVLYADVSGSTTLYEQHGDTAARAAIASCLQILERVAADYGGRTLKTIGDEVMCAFDDPEKAAVAAGEMHAALRRASEEGRFETGTLRIKLGWHYGSAEWREGDLVGEAPVTAQQIIRLAKPEETLLSGATLHLLPDYVKRDAYLIDTLEAEAWSGKLEVYVLPWEKSDDATRVSPAPRQAPPPAHAVLILEHAGEQRRVDAEHTRCVIGRAPESDLCVNGRFTSRHHAEIRFRHGRFTLCDDSINGTTVVHGDGRTVRLHREEEILTDAGTLCFGATPREDPAAVVHFRCE